MVCLPDKWINKADCRDKPVEWFFESYEQDVTVALDVDDLCKHCPVKRECFYNAVDTDSISTTGVRAGLYFVLGKPSKAKNGHKTPEEYARLVKQYEAVKEEISDR